MYAHHTGTFQDTSDNIYTFDLNASLEIPSKEFSFTISITTEHRWGCQPRCILDIAIP